MAQAVVRKTRVRVRPAGTTPVRYRYRAYPNSEQEQTLARLFGCVRVVFNDYIHSRTTAYQAGLKAPTHGELSAGLTAAKRTPEREWLAEMPAVALQQAQRDADQAYRNFFSSIAGTRRGRRVGAPKYRSKKDNRHTARFPTSASTVLVRRVGKNRGRLTLTGIPGELTLAWSRDLPSAASSVTVIREADGRHYVSFVVDRAAQEQLPATGRVVGIDLGLTDLATIIDEDDQSRKVDAARLFRKAEAKLAAVQKESARRKARADRASARAKTAGSEAPVVDPQQRRGGSSVREAAARRKVANLHRGVREARLDAHHKLARQLVRENQVIVLETLGITGLARTRMAKSVHDAGWGILTRLIEEKAAASGRTVIRVPRNFPSTRMCSAPGCTFVWGEALSLDVREWDCPDCGATHDRDVNAAANLRNYYLSPQDDVETINGRRDNDPGTANPRGDQATVNDTANQTYSATAAQGKESPGFSPRDDVKAFTSIDRPDSERIIA
ncbi:RNA-guided endonuclease InsQ/TnpB family protein [Leifsonia sp. Leaf264]|uniref:RNA-guided endonuclease InsQ/TnpB family protein n=1 Tax=Leifsonia sp. Leaf264 TaxID=1736314 RepID=UPI0006F4BDD5|nr:RNA-guided endonuclease TnpB family protein [Leifsonia sp. Leaf264]KQO98457.1 hypothetical protein ASF30_10370 [Leifsonia sp. Leaf264]